MANPPFNISDWGGERLREDGRWRQGPPPDGNANFAWIQHMAYHLAPRGFAGIVLANGSMSSTAGGEGEIRQRLIEDDWVDCMVALPGQLFYSTQIPVCIWFLAKDRSNGLIKHRKLRDRRGEILFIDARKRGFMVDRNHRDLHAEKEKDDGIPFEEKIQTLSDELAAQMAKSDELDAELRKQLARVGFTL